MGKLYNDICTFETKNLPFEQGLDVEILYKGIWYQLNPKTDKPIILK